MGRQLLYNKIASFNPTRFYKLDEATGTTAVDDGSDGVNLTHTNGPVVGLEGPKQGMRAVTYDGDNDVSTVASDVTIVDDQSIVILFKSTTAEIAAAEYLFATQTDISNRMVGVVLASDIIRWTHEVGGVDRSWDTTSDVYDGSWHLMSISFDNSALTSLGYVDGSSDGATGTNALGGNTGNTNLGAQTSTGGSSFDGTIALFAIINSEITAAQHEDLWSDYDRPDGMRNRVTRGLRRPSLVR